YHGVAMAKTILNSTRVQSGRRRKHGGEFASRRLVVGGKEAIFLEPRDYDSGRIAILGARGSICDYELSSEGALRLESLIDSSGACTGFRVGEHESRLDAEEASLMEGVPEGASATALMEAAKPVGFLRLLRALHRGEPGYPLAEGIDDMVVDYHLEKFGRYVANPLTSSRAPLNRLLTGRR
ncbi:MAG: hypothetical protein AAGG01_19950, partial [Planctomycetota bacterium]